MIPALHNEKWFDISVKKWKELGILYADEIIK